MRWGRCRHAGRAGRWLALLPLLAAGCGGETAPRTGTVVARVEATPDSVLIGEPVRVRYEVRAPLDHKVAFPPQPAVDSLWSWTEWRVGRTANSASGVHHELLGGGLAFRTGRVPLPSLRYRVTAPDGTTQDGEFPALAVAVGSVLPPGDPRPDIRPPQLPVQAPWWSRVPWVWIAVALAGAALAWWLWRRRPRRVARVEAVAAVRAPARPPHLVAFEALEALRAERLPEKGRFYEHQSRLSEILRRFIEARFDTPLPGYTSRELCLHLAWRGLDAAAVDRLSRVLRTADMTKFARTDPCLEEAHRLETEAEALIQAWVPSRAGEGGPEGAAAGEAPVAATAPRTGTREGR